MDLFFETLDRLTPLVRNGDLAGSERAASEALGTLPETPFHIATRLSITNDPADAAAFFDRFFVAATMEHDSIEAIYTEMNGFDINPNRWFCELFAYSEDGGVDDLDWLSDWQFDLADDYTITGLERLQDVYASPAFQNEAYRDASYLSSIVVVTKFQHFLQRAATHMSQVQCPIYVTAHDYDFIARVEPAISHQAT